MFAYDWESHLGQALPLLWLFTHEENERINLTVIRQLDGTFELYEGEDGKLFPSMARIIEIAEYQTAAESTLVVVNEIGVITPLGEFGDTFQDRRHFFSWVMADPTGYDFEQIDQSMIVMTARA